MFFFLSLFRSSKYFLFAASSISCVELLFSVTDEAAVTEKTSGYDTENIKS